MAGAAAVAALWRRPDARRNRSDLPRFSCDVRASPYRAARCLSAPPDAQADHAAVHLVHRSAAAALLPALLLSSPACVCLSRVRRPSPTPACTSPVPTAVVSSAACCRHCRARVKIGGWEGVRTVMRQQPQLRASRTRSACPVSQSRLSKGEGSADRPARSPPAPRWITARRGYLWDEVRGQEVLAPAPPGAARDAAPGPLRLRGLALALFDLRFSAV